MNESHYKEPTLRKSFTIQKKDVLSACVYGANDYLAAGLSNGVVMLLPTKSDLKMKKWIGHTGRVTCIESCGLHDCHLVSGGEDGTVRVWVGNEGGDSMALVIGSHPITSLSLSNKFDRVLVADSNSYCSLWDPRHCSKISDLPAGESGLSSVSMSSDGLLALTGSKNGGFQLFDMRSGQITYVCDTRAPVTCTAIRQTGSAISCGLTDGTVLLWDSRTQAMLNDTPLHRGSVTSVDFHPVKPMLLTSADDGVIAVCDSDTRGLLYTLQCHTASVYSTRWAVDGSTFSSVGADNRVVMWDEPVIDYTSPLADISSRHKTRLEREKLTKFNQPIPRAESPPPEPEVEIKAPVKIEEANEMGRYVAMMHNVTDQIVSISRMLSKIESRMNTMDEQIAILEVQKRKQAKAALEARRGSS